MVFLIASTSQPMKSATWQKLTISIVCCLVVLLSQTTGPSRAFAGPGDYQKAQYSNNSQSRGIANIFDIRPASGDLFSNEVKLVSLETTETEDTEPQPETPPQPPPVASDQTNPVRHSNVQFKMDPSTPDQFKSLVENVQSGDYTSAKESAANFVEYLSELMFTVREVTHLIVEAMIEKGEKDEEEMRGVEQLMDWQSATARTRNNMIVKPTHEKVLARIKNPDSQNKAEVYFFFTLNCRYCRDMAPDIERLARSMEKDKRVSVTGMIMGNPPKMWVDSFKEYTGLNIPIRNGEAFAKKLRLAFLPAVIVISPSNNISYIRTGQQSFANMYEFVRTVQGLPKELDPKIRQSLARPLSKMEKLKQEAQNPDSLSEKPDPVPVPVRVGKPAAVDVTLTQF